MNLGRQVNLPFVTDPKEKHKYRRRLSVLIIKVHMNQIMKLLILQFSAVLSLSHRYSNISSFILCKGTAIPLQAWTDPEFSQRLRLQGFLI
jgi:hypothetical protein